MRLTQRSAWIWPLILCFLGIAALGSLVVGVRHAMVAGWDFQGDGARLLRQHIDIWREAIVLGPHRPHYIGPPNYLHHLYLMLMPYTLLSHNGARIAWCITNILLSVVVVWVLRGIFKLNVQQSLLVLFLLWMSGPFRVTLEVGQASFFELLFISMAYGAAAVAWRGLSLGVSFAKYSFSPLAVALFFFRGKFRLLLFACLIPLAGVTIVRLIVPTPWMQLLLEPFRVAQLPTSVSPGVADAMTFGEQVFTHWLAPMRAEHVAYLAGLALCLLYALGISRVRLSLAGDLTVVSIGSLFFMKHLSYDYVFLVVVLCFALTVRHLATKSALILSVAIFWYVKPVLLGAESPAGTIQVAINFILLAALLAGVTFAVVRENSLLGSQDELPNPVQIEAKQTI